MIVGVALLAAAEAPQKRIVPARWAELISQKQYERFLSLVEADIRARKLTPTITPDAALRIKEDPYASSAFGLDNLVQKCRLAKEDKWPLVIHEHFDNLLETVVQDARLGEKLKKLENAMPLLAVRIYGEGSVPPEAKKNLVWRSDLEGTITVLVLDLPTSLKSVTPDQLKAWDAKPADLFDRALKNAAQNVPVEIVQDALPGGAKLVAIVGQNLLVSSHALFLKEHPEAIGKGGALVGVPTRHIVVCHPINDRSALGAMERMVTMIKNLEREGPGSTSDKLYWYHDGKFQLIPARADGRGFVLQPPDQLLEAINQLPQSHGR
jgi:hypothetical protein